MPRREDIRGVIFCNKVRKFNPNFGKSHNNRAKKITTELIIKIVFDCLKLLLSELSILSTALLVLLISFVFKNGRNIHITNKIKTKKRIRRTIKIYFWILMPKRFQLM